MKVITLLGDEGIIWIVCAVALLFFKKYRKAGVAMLVALAVMLVCNNVVLKYAFDRVRPFNLDLDWWKAWYSYPDMVTRPTSPSFPSGHTSSSFAGAMALTMIVKQKRFAVPAFILASLIAFSRIYVFVHYPTDVIGGLIVGIIYGIIGVVIAKRLYPIIEKRISAFKAKRTKKA